ncbi:MAG: HAD family hydrolase [Deltaproteobacteria bacterium]|nr:HAD family hydrolase [Deltaproteobacteria bacterium]
MKHIRAVAFDLFNTLITVEPQTLEDANTRLFASLSCSDFSLEAELFAQAHHRAAVRHIKESRKDWRETHNSLWISAALEEYNYFVPPDDSRIALAVDAYFSAFMDHCRLIPDTLEMLTSLQSSYHLGLLSNFTHGPAARKLLSRVGLDVFFGVVIISGEVGYRKPHRFPFMKLVDRLGLPSHQVVYVGDDPEPDIFGAKQAGLQPVWSTYVRDLQLPHTAGILSSGQKVPQPDVPTISKWDDLFSLLRKDFVK